MQKFGIERIKSFSSLTQVEIKPITIFVGKNSSGKSSLIRFPAVLAQTFSENMPVPLNLWENLVDYGSFEDILFQHKGESFRFSIGFGSEIGRFARYLLNDNLVLNQMPGPEVDIRQFNQSELFVELSKKKTKLQVKSIELFVENRKLCRLDLSEDDSYQLTLHQQFDGTPLRPVSPELTLPLPHLSFYRFIPQFDEDDVIFEYCQRNGLLLADAAMDVLVPGKSFYLWSSWIKKEHYQEAEMCYHTLLLITVFFLNMRRQLQRDAETLSYIGPFRKAPQRILRNPEGSFTEVGVRGEYTEMLLWQAAQEQPWIVEQVSQWLHTAMGYRLGIEEVGRGNYSVMLDNGQENDNLMDVGYGISQVLPIVTQLYADIFYDNRSGQYSQKESRTLILEQPELHLHPAAQAQLADLFADCVDRKNRKNGVGRLLIETHSEHLIRRLQVLVADPLVNLSSDEIAVYYVDKTSEGCSFVEEMKLSETGQFQVPWPSGFFDKSYELTKELMRANSKRRSSAEWRKE